MDVSAPKIICRILAIGGLCFAFVAGLSAQVSTQRTETSGQATQQVQVERAEVLLVSGNDVLVKMEDGTIKHVENVPESARVTVGGQELGVHDLKPGMKLQRTITTTTTPKVITTVQTVTGTVWQVTPPLSVTLTLENGENQQFKIPQGQKFNVDGQEVDAFGLKKGMKLSATKVVEEPETVVEQHKQLTGSMPPPPPPPADAPILVIYAPPQGSSRTESTAPTEEQKARTPETTSGTSKPSETSQPASAAPTTLPQTASPMPLLALLGIVCCILSFGMWQLRRS